MLVGKSSGASGTRQLSPAGETASEPRVSPSTAHSSSRPSRHHGAALDGEAETKYCCHALVRSTSNDRSHRTFVAPDGQSAANPSRSAHAASTFV